ncbi:MAG: AraC family transcriptional regulator [Opitutaceae bacterium]|nr:AraC family transcriptional regulator [Opitutaceae bacterium]
MPSLIRRRFALPPPALRPFVERLWSWESDGPVPLPLLLPGTGADLLFHYRTPFLAVAVDGTRHRLAAAHISCLRACSCRLVAQGPVGFLAVRFRSSTIRHLGMLAMGDLIGRFPAAAEHFGAEIDRLPAQLAGLPDFAARAEAVTQFLLARLERSAPVLTPGDGAVDALYYAEPGETVAALADDLGYSARQLERLVGEAAGITPKRFLRLARLHHTVRHLLLTKEVDYLDAALARGYYDQAHFIHEMGDLTGRTPGQVLTPGAFVSHFYNPRLPR